MSLNPKIREWQGSTVWLIGASSGIGEALAHELSRRGASLVLSARSADKLTKLASDLSPRSGTRAAMIEVLDVNEANALSSAMTRIKDKTGEINLVVWLAGNYAPMGAVDFNTKIALDIVQVNFSSVLNGLGALLPLLLDQTKRNRPTGLALVSSVAGYSGLPKALAYGPSKAALINLAESLYLHCHGLGLGVYLVNPGFVATPLTAQNTFEMPALQTPSQAALAMVRGFEAGDFEIHFPARFTRWLKLLRILPYWIYFPVVARFTKH